MAMDSCVNCNGESGRTTRQARKGGLLKNQLVVLKRKDCNRFTVDKIKDELSYDKGFYLFIRASQLLTQKNEGIIVVGLAGPSGAGKTVFCEKVLRFMPGITAISMDSYNDASRLIDDNYDDPRLTDYDTLLQNIQNLKDGKPAEIPIYDFKLSSRIGYRTVYPPASRILIIEGIFALSEKLRPLLDLRVSVNGGVHFDLVKRVLRDIDRSGQAPSEIINQIAETVYPMYKAYIEPDLETAQIKIINKFNPFSGFQTPTYILKSTRIATEDQIREVLSKDDTGKTEETYDLYLLPPGEDAETCQSYLRMRNRDGKYTLMFEEWVTDSPFVISPRITFEVGVRLLGGLMALGYTLTLSLKRVSRVFTDDKVIVKIDKLQQPHMEYIQVQGKERSLVAEVARKLGLDGSYVPNSYIEQIQLEKLTTEVMLPEDLKNKLQSDSAVSSPLPSFSWISEAKPGIKNQYSRSWSRNNTDDIFLRNSFKEPLALDNACDKNDSIPDSPLGLIDHDLTQISDQIAGVNERLDEVLSRIVDFENKFPQNGSQGNLPQHGSGAGSFGNSLYAVNCSGNPNGLGSSPIAAPNASGQGLDPSIIEEVKNLWRGQRHLTKQFDVLSNLLRDSITNTSKHKNSRRYWGGFFGNMRTNDSGLAIASVVTIAIGGVLGMIISRTWRTQ